MNPLEPETNSTEGGYHFKNRLNYTEYRNDSLRTGYIQSKQNAEEYHYFLLAESRSEHNATDPLIVWLQGDCSALRAFFLENGPHLFEFEPLGSPAFNITRNNYSWNSNASVLYLDFPMGNGFSTQPRNYTYRFEDRQLEMDFYTFMIGFMSVFPEFRGRDLFIFGEGLAGHLVPVLAHIII